MTNLRPWNNRRMLINSRLIVAIATCFVLLFCSSATHAQVTARQSMPPERYLNVAGLIYSGEYADALDAYQDYNRSAYRFGSQRYFDSVCFLTMMGECMYHMGRYEQAVDSYDEALKLYLAYPTWQNDVQFPANVAAANSAVQRARISWGSSSRRFVVGRFPDQMSVQFGDVGAGTRVQQQGGVYNPAELRPVNIVETMRCVALALHRRTEILGRINKHNSTTQELVDRLSSSGPGSNTMAGAWQRIFVGIANRANGDLTKAKTLLANSLVIGGFDHPLTPVALLELGHIAVAENKLAEAKGFYEEASYSAAIFGQYDYIEESLRWASIAHMMQGNKDVYPKLNNAIAWARQNDANAMWSSLLVQQAWNLAELGMGREAQAVLNETRRPMSRTELPASLVGSRLLYVSSLAAFQQNDISTGLSELASCIKQFQRAGSKWIYQLEVADALAQSNGVTPRLADILYSEMLREPTDLDWMVDPMEPMTFLLTPHTGAMERWFKINMLRKQTTKAIEIGDQIKRHRFFESLSLGGRLMSFRWLLEAPDVALKQEFQQTRIDMLARYPGYKQLAAQSEQIRRQIDKLPMTPDRKSDEGKQQLQLFKELYSVSQLQEAILAAMALKREPSPLVFPPRMEIREVQAKMSDKQIIIICNATAHGYYITSITKNEYKVESEPQIQYLKKGLNKLLKEIGNRNANAEIDSDILQDESWKTTALQFTSFLFPQRPPEFWDNYDEVVVVPDGILWYLPFELLRVGDETNAETLFSKLDVRYAPTMSTAVPDGRTSQRFARTAVVTGRINNRDDEERIKLGFEDLKNEIPGAVAIDARLPADASVFSSTVDQLLVWNDLRLNRNPYTMTIMSPAAGRNDTLGNIMELPWQGVEHVVLPGLSTAAAGGARSAPTGHELFLSACGLMASGSRTVVLSRWKVGGQSTLDLTREFIRELPTSSASEAWRRSVELLHSTPLDYNAETRIKASRDAPPMKTDHPFFWAGYLVIDMGSKAKKDQLAEGGEGAGDGAGEEKDAAAEGADGAGAEGKEGEAGMAEGEEGGDKKSGATESGETKAGEGTEKKSEAGEAGKEKADDKTTGNESQKSESDKKDQTKKDDNTKNNVGGGR